MSALFSTDRYPASSDAHWCPEGEQVKKSIRSIVSPGSDLFDSVTIRLEQSISSIINHPCFRSSNWSIPRTTVWTSTEFRRTTFICRTATFIRTLCEHRPVVVQRALWVDRWQLSAYWKCCLDRQLEDLYYSRQSPATRAPAPSETFPYRRSHNHFSGSVDNPFVDLSFTMPNRPAPSSYRASWDPQSNRRSTSIFGSNPFAAPNPRPPEPASRRNHVTSTNAGRSLEGDARPILGAARERSRPVPEPIEESEAPVVDRPRRNTFVLDEPSLPDLPQSGAQRPRDTVNVQELYNVRPRDRAQTPVTFTININETSSAANPSDGSTHWIFAFLTNTYPQFFFIPIQCSAQYTVDWIVTH